MNIHDDPSHVTLCYKLARTVPYALLPEKSNSPAVGLVAYVKPSYFQFIAIIIIISIIIAVVYFRQKKCPYHYITNKK